MQPTEPTPNPTSSDQQVNEPQAVEPPQKPTSHSKRIWVILAGVLIILAAIAALAYLNRPISKPSAHHEVPLLRVGMTEPMSQALYPDDVTDTGDAELNNQIFEGLTRVVNKTRVVPALATGWSNPDATHWSFQLRKNVYFHNGHTMTSKQVKASLESVEQADFFDNLNLTIKSISTPDANTVVIETEQPDALLANKMVNLFIYDTDAGKVKDGSNGTGPYTLKAGSKFTDDEATLVAFDRYYEGRPLVREVQIHADPEQSNIVKGLKSNQYDLVALHDYEDGGSSLSSDYVRMPLEGYSTFSLYLNSLHGKAPLRNLAVRQAIAQAIDRDALAKIKWEKGYKVSDQAIAAGVPGYDSSRTVPKADPAAAKAALAKAGYPNGLSFTFTFHSSNQPLADELKKQLAAVGVTVVLDSQTDGNVLAKDVSEGLTDSYYRSIGSAYFDGSDVLQYALNAAFYKNDAVATLIDKANASFDVTKRISLLQEADAKLVEDGGLIPLFESPPSYTVSKPQLVSGVDVTSGETGVYYSKIYQK